MKTTQEKYQLLLERLRALGSVAVAFSGGVDSALLLRAAHDALGRQAIAITADSRLFPQRELEEAKAFCRQLGVRHLVFPVDALAIEGFRQNPKNRCYLCKHVLFERIQALAREQGMAAVAEGSNVDDMGDYRPGLKAVEELGAVSPLREAGLNKAEIRDLSKALGLPNWDKPSYACLASRFTYGETITREKLEMVDQAEQLLLDLGFRQPRVRLHGSSARIEILPEDFERLLQARGRILPRMRALGFHYITLDLEGYRTGSMNEQLQILPGRKKEEQ